MKTTVFLLRHGETKFNAEHRVQGQSQNPLNARGKKQSLQLRKFFESVPVDLVYSSPLRRALQTAKIAFPNRDIHTENAFRERGFGILEGMRWKKAEKKFPAAIKEYNRTRELPLEGTETAQSVKKRAKKALEQIVRKNPGKTIALVGHGLMNKFLLSALLNWSTEKMVNEHQHNASIGELEFENNQWKLVKSNSVGHLEKTHFLKQPTAPIEKAVKKWESKTDFKSHDFLHVKRVATGAQWVSKILGQDFHQQELAYLAGLVHDLGRPKTEKKDHTESSVRLAKKLLNQFHLTPIDKEHILELVESHRIGKTETEKQVVFLADKVWEQMGAYVVFRRAIFVKEVTDYKEWDLREAFIAQHAMRTKRFYPAVFPKRFRKLAEYQFQWATEAGKAIEKHEPWLLELIQHCARNAEKKGKSIDGIIKSFKPTHKQGKRYQKEAILYITGKRIGLFERLVKK